MEKDNDTGAIAICALRYCVGRRTYMPSLVIDWVKRHWNSFSAKDKAVMLKDLNYEINSGRNLGDSCDIKTWHDFKRWMYEEGEL